MKIRKWNVKQTINKPHTSFRCAQIRIHTHTRVESHAHSNLAIFKQHKCKNSFEKGDKQKTRANKVNKKQ